jgi:hypothetical protein
MKKLLTLLVCVLISAPWMAVAQDIATKPQGPTSLDPSRVDAFLQSMQSPFVSPETAPMFKGSTVDTTWVVNYFLLEADGPANYFPGTGSTSGLISPLIISTATDSNIFRRVAVLMDQVAARDLISGDSVFYRVNGQVTRMPDVMKINQIRSFLFHIRNNQSLLAFDTIVTKIVIPDTIPGTEGLATPFVYPSSNPAKVLFRKTDIVASEIAGPANQFAYVVNIPNDSCVFPRRPFFVVTEFFGAPQDTLAFLGSYREVPGQPGFVYFNQWLKTVGQQTGRDQLSQQWSLANVRNTVGQNQWLLDFAHQFMDINISVGPAVRSAAAACQTNSPVCHQGLTFSFPVPISYCDTAGPLALTASPPGGTFSGPGVSGSSFSPAGLDTGRIVTISYSVTTSAGCDTTFSRSFRIAACSAGEIPDTNLSRNALMHSGLTIEKAFPNPIVAGSDLTIPFSLDQATDVTIMVTNLVGQQVFTRRAQLHAGDDQFVRIPTAGFQSGVYTYTFSTPEGKLTGKFLVY